MARAASSCNAFAIARFSSYFSFSATDTYGHTERKRDRQTNTCTDAGKTTSFSHSIADDATKQLH